PALCREYVNRAFTVSDHDPGVFMALAVAVQMDPIERINVRGDSTFAILLEAQARGHKVDYYTPDRLAMRDGEVFTTVQALNVRDTPGDHFRLGDPRRVALKSFDVVLL